MINEYKCSRCGSVHAAITRKFALASSCDIDRLTKGFRFGAPSLGFVRAASGQILLLRTLQKVVLQDGK